MSDIRAIALMIILLRAGLHLEMKTLKKISFASVRIVLIPFLAEIAAVAASTYYFLSIEIGWAMLSGFVMSAVSPAVVVPFMIRIQKAGLSEEKGLPTLIIAASSIWDVLSVTGFVVCLSFVVKRPSNSTLNLLLRAPLQILVGVLYGTILGVLLWYLPEIHRNQENQSKSQYDLHRLILLLLAAYFAMFGSDQIDLSGSGPLAILILSFVASIRWRKYGWLDVNEKRLRVLWSVFKPYLFCLVGFNVRFSEIRMDIVVLGFVCFIIGLICRSICEFLMTHGLGLNYKERLFSVIAWIPKATVQAAVGPVALDYARNERETYYATVIVTMAILSVLITAPLGAIAIDSVSGRLLSKNKNQDLDEEEEGPDETRRELNLPKEFEAISNCPSLDERYD